MAATGLAIMEVDPGSVAGTAVDRFLDEPLARGLNGETAVDRFLDEPSDLRATLMLAEWHGILRLKILQIRTPS